MESSSCIRRGPWNPRILWTGRDCTAFSLLAAGRTEEGRSHPYKASLWHLCLAQFVDWSLYTKHGNSLKTCFYLPACGSLTFQCIMSYFGDTRFGVLVVCGPDPWQHLGVSPPDSLQQPRTTGGSRAEEGSAHRSPGWCKKCEGHFLPHDLLRHGRAHAQVLIFSPWLLTFSVDEWCVLN